MCCHIKVIVASSPLFAKKYSLTIKSEARVKQDKQGSHLAELEPRVVASWRDLMASNFIIKTYFLISRIQFLISRNRIPDITKSSS